MINILDIKHIHHLLELLLYTPDTIENVSDLKYLVNKYCSPTNENQRKEITLKLIEYSLLIGAKKIYFLDGKGEYSLSNNNVNDALQILEEDWLNLQTTRKINNQEWLIEYWLEWTDEFREELKRIDILKK